MKQIYHFTGTAGKQQSLKAGVVLLLMGVMLTLLPTALQAQVLQRFTQRTSDYSPDMPIYHIKGDYTMIGNTSVTFNAIELGDDCNNNYNNSDQNWNYNYNRMKYVDVDRDTFPTINSSTAALTFSEEFGANPACSEVLYAGLYWTGRTDDSYVSRTTEIEVRDGEIEGGYTLTITQSGNDRIFTFTKLGSESVVLTMRRTPNGNNRYNYYVYNGNNTIDESYRTNATSYTASLDDPVQLPGTNYTITQLYWNSTPSECYAIIEVPTTTINPWTSDGGSQYYLNKIKIKHAKESEYTEVTASLANVYGGTSASSNIYAAYAEVTDYVRRNGPGNYTVADLVTNVGQNDGTGWIGCWGMVVVYENSKMKWRDITLFDGFANVEDGNDVTIPISGFKTVQVGDVNVKLGMMAAEGDRGISGDKCGILRQADGDWQYLYHAGHTTQSADNNNFFNSSIQTGENFRYPKYVNNTGIDIAMFNIPNENNEVLDNEQTSTTFQFTSSQDLYFPFCFVMGVDAYIPEAEALSGVMNIDEDDISIDSQTGNYLIEPGKEITFEVEVKNFGTEDILNAKLEIPLPSTIVYYRTAVDYVYPGINIEGYFDAERYANGVAGWNIDYIPSGYPDTVYARVLLTVKVTEDCYVLASTDPECELAIEVNGTLEGTSYVNRVYFKKESFISGFADSTSACQGNAIRNDIKVVVYKESYVNSNCQDQDYTERVVTVCENEFIDSPIPFMKIYALYPQGSRFFNTETGEEYTEATGFPISLADEDTSSATLIHVQPTSIYSAACTSDLRFILDPDGDSFTTTPTLRDSTYCLDAQADSLSRHISTPPSGIYYRFYKERSDSAVAYVDIVPPTDVEDTLKYWVRQFRKNAIGCEDENFYGPITIEVVSPITFRSSRVSPSCIGDTVRITGMPEGGRWSWPDTLTGIDTLGNVLTIAGTSAGTYTVTYTNDNAGTVGYSCTNTVRSYTHQIAATTDAGDLQSNQTICQGAQIQPLQIVDHNGHVERWEWTTDTTDTEWDWIPNNTSSISTADLGELAAGTYYFRALVKDGNCDTAWTNTVTITVRDDDAPNPPTVTSPQYACIGTDYTIQPSGGNYQWYEQAIGGWPIKDAEGHSVNSVTVKITDAWITRYVSEVAENGCVSDRAEVQVRPNLEPGEINDVGQRECDLGQSADEIGSDQNAVAYGEEPTVPQYQWYVQVNGDTTLREIDGANSATFTPSAYMGEEGEYIFIRKAKNPNCESENWQQSRGKWRLVVGEPDASIKAVPGHATICENGSIKLHLSVPASTAYSYQWYKDGDSIPLATGHEYIAREIGTYTARVTHKASGCSATTPEAGEIEVKYDDDAPRATSVDTTLNGCSIEDAQDEPTYSNVADIKKSIADGGLGISISDAITPDNLLTLTYIGETQTVNPPTGVCYQLVRTYTVTDQCGFSTTFTHTINVVDDVAPSIGTIEVPAAVPAGSCKYKIPDLSAATLAVSSDSCSDVSFVEQTPAAGFEYSQTNTEQTDTVVVKVKDACNNETIKEVQITIPAIPTISAAGSALDCYGDSDGNISYTITGGTAGYTVVLSGGSATQTATPTPTAAGTYTFTGLAAGTYTVTVTDANGCTATASAIVDEPDPLSVSLTKVDETCVGNDGKINYTIEGGTAGTAGYTVVLRDSSANQIANQTATDTNTFTGLKAGTYTVTVTDGNTCVATATATITLNKNFTVTARDTAVCSGTTFTINPEASHTANYSWEAPTATDITGAAAGSNASNISGTLTNTTTSATSITYNVTATTANGLCTASPFEVEVTVYAPVTGGSIQKNFISCNVADTIVTLTNDTAGNGGYGGTYGWEKSTDNGTTWTPIPNSNGVDYTLNYHDNLGTVLYRRMYNANCDEKPSNTVSVTYYGNVNPGTVVCSGEGNDCAANYCSGSNISVTLSTSDIDIQSNASYSIQWQQSTDNGATWTNISGETSDTYTYTNPNFTSSIQFRYTITVTGCAPVPSNNVHNIGVWALPVVSIAEVATLCPSAASTDIKGTIETIITPNYTYHWSAEGGLTLPTNLPESDTSATSNTIRGTFSTTDCNATYRASLYVVDGNGCQSNTAIETFTVVDTIRPTFTRPADITIYTNDTCGYDASVSATGDVTNEADNCSTGIEATYTDDTVADATCEGKKVITRTWSLVDNCGNSAADQVQTITVLDTIRPTFTAPANTIIYTDASCGYNADTTITGSVTNKSDNCSTNLTVTYRDAVAEGDCQGKKVITRTWRVVDACGNVSISDSVQTITVEDTIAPTITCRDNFTRNTDNGQPYATVTLQDPTPVDNCSATYSISYSPATPTNATATNASGQYPLGETIVTYSVVDGCGNADSCSFTITVSDNQAPEIACTVTGNQDTLPNSAGNTYTHSGNSWDATATDNVAVTSLTYTLTGATVDNTPKTTLDGQVFNYGTTTVTWKATDNTGASDVCSFQVVVADNTEPELKCPTIATVYECLAEVPATYANYAAFTAAGGSATDNHQINESSLTVTDTVVTGCPTTITRTYSIKDMTGNAGTCTQVITVEDKTAPALTGTWPANITGQNNCFANRNISGLLSNDAVKDLYTDNCGGELTVTSRDTVTGDDCGWTITRTYTIKDSCGNTVSPAPTMSVSGSDRTAPELKATETWPSNLPDQNSCFADADTTGLKDDNEIKALYSDCSAITVTHEDAIEGNNCGWTVTRTYTITDLCDSTVMPKPTMSVSGSDQTKPYIMPAVLDRTLTATGCEFIIPDMREEVRAISSDGCTGNSALTVEQPSAGMQVYPQVIARDTNVIIRVTDSCGNYSLKSVKITIPAKVVITATATPASICNGETAQLSTTVTNVVGAASYVWEPTTGLNSTTIYNPTTTLTATDAPETVTYTVKVTDANGCTATATTFVTVNPEVVIYALADTVINSGTTVPAKFFTTPLTGGVMTYSWTRTNTDVVTGMDATGTGNVPGATLYNNTNTAKTTTITVTPTFKANGISCVGATVSYMITVNPTVVMEEIEDQAICHGSEIEPVTFGTTITDATTFVYNWVRTNSDVVTGMDTTGIGNIDATALYNETDQVQVTTFTVTPTYTNNDISSTGTPITFTITVYPKVGMETPDNQSICHGSAITAVNFSSDLTGGDITYTWRRTNNNIDGLDMSGTGNIPTTVLTNTTNRVQVDTIYVKPTYEANSNVCDDDSVYFTITVNPKVGMETPDNQSICHGSAITAVNFSSDLTGGDITYTWRRTNSNVVGLAMSGTGNIAAATLTNTTTTAQVDTIYVKPTYEANSNVCDDDSVFFTITVNPEVRMDTPDNQAICHGTDINSVVFTTPITDGTVVYNWTRTNDNIGGLASSGTGNIPATVLTNTTNTVQVDTITVTPVYTNNGNECTDETITFTITVNPKVVMNDVADQAICHGSAITEVNFTTPITDGSVVYNWSRNNENIEGLEMSGTGNIAAATLTNTTNTAQTTTITVTPVYTNNGNECTDESITFTITVNPEVVMNTVADWTLCVGETSPEYIFESEITDGAITYGWHNNTPAIGLAAMGEGNLPSFVAANDTPANLIAEVKAAPTYTNNGISCQGDSINFHITVRPSINTPGNVAFTCPADTTVVLSYSECEQFVNIGYPEFVNNMSGMTVNITNDAPEGNIFPEGTTIVTWTATDDCGAFLTCTQNVVVQFPSCGDSIADFDGYRYSSVRIGCQCWTGENARSEHYSDGTPVDNFRYYNDSDSLENIYGKLYTWYTAVRVPEGDDTAVPADSIDPLGNSYVQGICPEGWALPTVDEYMLMIANSGDATHAKDGSNLYWLPGYEGQPPFSGFDAYGAGKYNGAIDRYQDLLGKTYFWTTLSGSGSETATTVEINYYCAEGLQTELSKGDGVSIRCIRKR